MLYNIDMENEPKIIINKGESPFRGNVLKTNLTKEQLEERRVIDLNRGLTVGEEKDMLGMLKNNSEKGYALENTQINEEKKKNMPLALKNKIENLFRKH